MSYNRLYDLMVQKRKIDPQALSFEKFAEALPSPLRIEIDFINPGKPKYTSSFTAPNFEKANLLGYGEVLDIRIRRGDSYTQPEPTPPVEKKAFYQVVSMDKLTDQEKLDAAITVEEEDGDEPFLDDDDELPPPKQIQEVSVSLKHFAESLAIERAATEVSFLSDDEHGTKAEKYVTLVEFYIERYEEMILDAEAELEELYHEEEEEAIKEYEQENRNYNNKVWLDKNGSLEELAKEMLH